jgi:MFS family permease
MGRRRIGAWFGSYQSALAQRDLRLLLGGLIISATGSWAYNVGLLALVFSRTHSLTWVGAAGLVRFVPSLLFSAYGGVIAERTERIRLLVASDLLSALWQAGLVVVAATGLPVALAFVLSALTQISGTVYSPAVAATIPSIVNEDDLVAANALNGTIDNLVVIIGPAVGALVLIAGSTAAVFGVNAGSFLISAVMVARIRTRSRPVDVTDEGRAGPMQQMLVGIRTIVTVPAARSLVAFTALVSFVYGTDTVLFVGVSEHQLGTGSHGFGYLLAALGVGGVLVAPAVERISRLPRLGPIIIIGVAGYTLPTALLTVTHSLALAFLLEVVRGGSTLVVDVLALTALQRAVPGDQLARVFGVFFAFVLAAISLGTIVTPALVSAFGLHTGLWVMAVAPFVIGVLGYPSLLNMDRASAARAAALSPKVGVLEQLGIFAAASRRVLEKLASDAIEVTFAPAAVILSEGDPADALYVLVHGEVEVTAHTEPNSPGQFIRTMTAPSYFGEIGVLERIPRTATVTARTECRCERIEGEALLDALTSAPPSSALMENARNRLLVTHPSREPTYTAR